MDMNCTVTNFRLLFTYSNDIRISARPGHPLSQGKFTKPKSGVINVILGKGGG
jgi:hypothetical protein